MIICLFSYRIKNILRKNTLTLVCKVDSVVQNDKFAQKNETKIDYPTK